jgi:anthranilate phosphoribosyltransferase
MTFKHLFEKIYDRQNLTVEESRSALLSMLEGTCEPPQISAFLTALHLKGETSEELAGFALAMRQMAVEVPIDGIKTMDTCGTGGDRKGSFNISTLTAFVAAGAGIPVAKHGNRAASSLCGSADLLEALGIRARLKSEEAAEALEKTGFAFLFAPDYHPATQHVVKIRRLLGVPTLFNYLGPITNPAKPHAQLIGVFDQKGMELMAAAFQILEPGKKILLLHSIEGWDEATTCGDFITYSPGQKPAKMNAKEFGLKPCLSHELSGEGPETNAQIALSILKGEPGPKRDAVLLNAALAIQLFNPNRTVSEALSDAAKSIDSGDAFSVVRQLKEKFPFNPS